MTTLRLVIGSIGVLAAAGVTACASEAPSESVVSGSSELQVCAPGATLTGIDVAEGDNDVDWTQVKASGRSFAFARVSDGLPDEDGKFAENWAAMKSAGLVRGAYQFFRARHGDNRQADLLVRAIVDAGGLQRGDLPPVLDLEVTDGQKPAVVVARAKAWLARVQSKLGVKPIVYTGNNMSDTIGTSFEAYRLWVAHYGVSCPRIPGGWTTWTFWQDGEASSVPGVSTKVDTDFFNGTRADLEALTVRHAVGATAAEKDSEPDEASTEELDDEAMADAPEGSAVMGGSAR